MSHQPWTCPNCGREYAVVSRCQSCNAKKGVESIKEAAARSRTREIMERLRGPGCVVDGSEKHTDCDPCNLCEGVADWLESEYLSAKGSPS